MDFVNLHLHSEYSLGDSVVTVDRLVNLLKEYNQSSCAITDHGSLAGQFEFYTKCNDNGIKPILGLEVYTNPTQEHDRNRNHLVLLAKDHEGLINIRKIQNESVNNFYYKPIATHDMIFDNSDGIFCSTACSLGLISQYILNGDLGGAVQFWEDLEDAFGKENLSLEFQFHPDYPDQAKINEGLLELKDEVNPKYITATCDTHYLNANDRDLRRIIQAANWHKPYKDVNMSLESNCLGNAELVMKFAEQSGFSDLNLVPEMIGNTCKIADKIEQFDFIGEERKIPKFENYKELEQMLGV